MEYAVIALELIAEVLKNYEAGKTASPETLADMIAKATAAKAALLGLSADLAANDAKADADLKTRLGTP